MRAVKRCVIAAVAAALGTVPLPALSQEVPPAVDPGQLQRELTAPLTLEAPPPAPVLPRARLDRPGAAADVKLTLNDIRISGNERIDDEALRTLYAPRLGKEVSLDEVYDIADLITAEYRRSGYILSQAIVPQQTIEGGVVEILVIEGFLERVEYAGDPAPEGDLLTRYGNSMTRMRPLELASLERNMLLMNDLPGLVAGSSVGPLDGGEAGAARLRVTSSHDPFDGALGLSNRGSRRIGPVQLDASANVNVRSARYLQLGVRALAALDGQELGLFNGFADVGVGRSGDRIRFAASALRSEPDIGFDAFDDLETEGTTFELTWSRPLKRSRLANRFVDVGLALYQSDTLGQEADVGEFGTDTSTRTRKVFVGLRLDQVDGGRGVNQLQLSLSQGIDGLGAKHESLSDEDPDLAFTTLSLFGARLQALGGGFSLLGALSGQISLSGDGLPVSETFGVGGQEFVRAYDGSEITGPSGVAAKLELRRDPFALSSLRLAPYVFYDIGTVDDDGPAERSSLSSTGFGGRFSLGAAGGYAELALPLDGDVNAESDDDPRVFAGISYQF